MSDHRATVSWRRDGAVFVDNRYSRAHEWRFDGGAVIGAAASPSNVRPPYTNPALVDPEEAFVASISSCHMLWFLDIASKRRLLVESYEDEASGVLEPGPNGKVVIARVVLRPKVRFEGSTPAADEVAAIHRAAHDECFIAHSVRSEIVIEPR